MTGKGNSSEVRAYRNVTHSWSAPDLLMIWICSSYISWAV